MCRVLKFVCIVVIIALLPLNAAAASNRPPNAVNDLASTMNNTSVTISVLENDSDPDADALSILSAVPTVNGAVVVNGSTITYTPKKDYFGTDSFTYTISDGKNHTATATVIVKITSSPVALDDSATTTRGVSVTISVLENDIDPDGDTISIISAESTENGSTQVHGTNITYTPDDDFYGTDTFTYLIQDSQKNRASAKVTVRVYAPPIAVDDSSSTMQNTAVTIPVLQNDSDPDGDALSLVTVSAPSHGSAKISGTKIVYTPDNEYYGNDSFSYTIADSQNTKDTAVVRVFVNAPPNAEDDSAMTAQDVPLSISVLANDSDPNNHSLTIQSVSTPSHGSVTIDGTEVIYTPQSGYYGTDTFTYTISDGRGGTDTATVTVTVNTPPKAVDDKATTPYGTPAVINVLENDIDPNGDELTVVSASGAMHGTATIVENNIQYTPALGYHGTDTFTYTIKDAFGATDTANVKVTVLRNNTPPVAVDDSYWTYQNLSITILVLENDSDPEGDTLTVTEVNAPSNGTVYKNGINVVYVPKVDFIGNDSFSYIISDGFGGTAAANVRIKVYKPDSTVVIPPQTYVYDDTAAYEALIEQDIEDAKKYSIPYTGTYSIDPLLIIIYTLAGINGVLFYLKQMNKKR